jgi:MFS family permease
MSPIQTLRQSIRLLGTRRFGTFWVASLLSSIGTWAQQVAEPWLLLTLGASPFLVGLDSFAMNAPVWLLTLVGGALADLADRRRVILLFQSIQMLCPVLIVILLLAGRIQPWMIIVLALVVGITDALSMPSFQSIVPSIVQHDQIGLGIALNSTQFNLSRILGPSIAGVLMSSVGVLACFVVSAVSYVPFVGVALWILPRRRPPASPRVAGPRRSAFTGLGEVWRQRYQRDALLTVLVSSVFSASILTFSPVLVRDAFQGGAGDFSVAVAAFGVGGLLGATGLLSLPPGVDRRRLSSWCALGFGAVLVFTALDPWSWAVAPLLCMAGALMTVSNTAANALLQSSASSRLLGRTVSLYMLAMRGGLALGSLATGLAVSTLGVRNALLIDGAVAVGLQALLARAWRRSALPGAAVR